MRQPIPFGKYLLLDRISVGGMAEVFKAKSYGVEGFEKVIAIKRILPSMGEDRDFIKMFIDEAKIAGQLSHANICQIFELGRSEGSHFIAMEYIWGKDLLQLQNRYKKRDQVMPVAMACYIASKVCEGLGYAHRKKDALGRPLEIVHRDCSPQNVLISYEGEVKVIDFGIAKAASRSSRTMAGVLKGKFGYMSPEQVRGLPLDRRSDIFALGTILYESLTGERLFLGESDFSTLERVRNVDITPPTHLNRNIPPQVETIVMRALTQDANERYQWCSEMRSDLQAYLMSQPELFSAKGLSAWMKESFAAEVARERNQMEQYKQAGRDGLIQGVPQAEAKLDVVQYLGQAGDADDPTMLGGPSLDDMMADLNGAPPPAAGAPPPGAPSPGAPPLRAGGKQARASDFGEEAPTELFGEIAGAELAAAVAAAGPAAPGASDEDRPTYDRLQPVSASEDGPTIEVQDLGPQAAVMGLHAAALADEAQRAAAQAQNAAQAQYNAARAQPGHAQPQGHAHAQPQGQPGGVGNGTRPPDLASIVGAGFAPAIPQFTPPGVLAAGSHDGGQFAAGDQALFGSTASVAPLPAPASDVERLRAGKRWRSSVTRDVGIGVGIAVVVLGLFAGGKYLFFGDRPGTREAQAGAVGTIAVAVPANTAAADVWIGDEKVGVVQGGQLLTLERRPIGSYEIKVTRPGATDCMQQVEVAVGKPAFVSCTLASAPQRGTVVIEGLAAGHTVFLDDQEMSPEAARAPIALEPGTRHRIVVRRGEHVVKELWPQVIAGQELRRRLVAVAAVVPDPEPPAALDASAGAPARAGTRAPSNSSAGDSSTRITQSPIKASKSTNKTRAARSDITGVSRRRTSGKHGKHSSAKTRTKTDSKSRSRTTSKPGTKTDALTRGYLIANSSPWGARILIDGRDTGKRTPIAKRSKISLKPGKHRVTFVVGKQKFKYDVVVKAGEISKLVKDLDVTK